MKRQVAIDYFGSIPALAKALKITYEAVRQWGEEVPELRQYQLEKLTNGQLKAGPDGKSQSVA
ncbi:Cro/CI family transcriptional regulator [Pseudomonas protegens]|uniref:Cro/CI family transcriptional regulator n=1 Tax=Pseudomonas protegens TaxID=380021 RepID=UPI00275B6A28|nr:Cro/CI family transcriptional regulator [Pseudomonas protegens]MDP9511372.1 Cro/CI family transcriptional regulator [Pseudomonas protegens]